MTLSALVPAAGGAQQASLLVGHGGVTVGAAGPGLVPVELPHGPRLRFGKELELGAIALLLPNLSYPTIGIVRFYNGRGTAEQWIKEGKYALNWTRLSCHKFVANQVRLELFIMAYNLGNFLRRLVLPESMKHWSLTSLQTRMIKTGGRLVRHARRLVFQLAEVLVSREMLCGILERIGRLRLAPG